MKLFSFFKSSKSKPDPGPADYAPVCWPDDYCQIEIVPVENKPFVKQQVKEIKESFNSRASNNGFETIFERGALPQPTLAMDLPAEYLAHALAGYQFQKAKQIRYGKSKQPESKSSTTSAFGFPGFTVFFNTEKESVKNIWPSIAYGIRGEQFKLISAALYDLGQGCEMMLIDWHQLKYFDLSDKNRIRKFLNNYRKR